MYESNAVCSRAPEILGTKPFWISGRTTLIMKDANKGTVASNFRPITCLPLMWKLLTGMTADSLYNYLQDSNLLPHEQKGKDPDPDRDRDRDPERQKINC